MMKNQKLLFFFSHLFVLAVGFGLGVYLLPILTAPKSLEISKIDNLQKEALYKTEFVKDLRGSDLLHWGEAEVTISNQIITIKGSIAPGPDYKLYLTNEFVEHEDEFLDIKNDAKYIAEVKTFKNFVIDIPSNIDINNYNTVVIWCERFEEFITAAKYQ
ncbi:DM13 domain-containing protein [Candidatus Pelagibacter sp. HIMB1483]|uniref:DM13 domain-containing protein n=1 Tax=Candidatus Pelagibacter sp. HIMB1483 TaxID=3415414 RepID=UPI003F86EAFC